MRWTTACPDWEGRIERGQSLIPLPPLFPGEAASALEVFRQLRVVDMPGSPTMGEVSRQWVLDFVSSVFGSYDPETGRRLIAEFFLLISKKNTKSTTAAGIMLTVLIRNWRTAGEFGILAPTIEVANNAFKPARDMVRADPELSDLLHVQDHIRTITHRQTGATLQVVAAESEAVAGKKWIVTLIDELWLFGKKANAEQMLIEATGGLASRPEGFVIYLSTQSDEPPAGVFRDKLLYARGVRDGRIADNKFLPVLYEYPQKMLDEQKYLDPEYFYVTNPNLGASVDRAYLERELRKAQETGSPQAFLAKHLNVEIGLSLRSNRWPGADYWPAQADTTLTLDELLLRSDVVTLGLDGGGLDDLFGLTVIGRDSTGAWLSWSRAWAHPSVLERRKSEEARLRGFAADGHLRLVERMGDDIDEIVEIASVIHESGLLDKVGVDAVGIGAVVDALMELGIEQERIVAIPQGWRLAGAIKTVERKLAEGALRHDGSPLMAWCVGNAKVEPRGNAMLITKAAAGFAKIDPLMALFNAAALMALNPQSSGRSWWDRDETEAQAA